MTKITYYIITTICIVLSIVVIAGSYQLGLSRAMTGQDALIWLHVGAFLVVLVLIVAIVIARAKVR